MRARAELVVVMAMAALGCGEGDETTGVPGAGACGAGTSEREDGGCVPAGVPPDRCGTGFIADGADGCAPVLGEGCAEGWMAVPGDAACHELLDCGASTWGDIPVDGATVYVDASYGGADGDGSAARPWPTLESAYAAAAPGSLLALAEGYYEAYFDFAEKPVRIWGRCPARVTIGNPDPSFGAVIMRTGMEGTELRGVAVTSAGPGVLVLGSTDVLLDAVWIHDTAAVGLKVSNQYGPSAVRVSGTLVERATEQGIDVDGAEATIASCAVRDTRPRMPDGGRGYGIQVIDGVAGNRSLLTIEGTVVERNHDAGIVAAGSDVTVNGTVVEDMLPLMSLQTGGHGIAMQRDISTSQPSTLAISGSVVRRNFAAGVVVDGSTGVIEATTVDDTKPQMADGGFGRAIGVQPTSGARPSLVLRDSILRHSLDGGIVLIGGDLEMTRSAIVDVAPLASSGEFGDGLCIDAGATQVSAVVSRSLVAAAARAGIASFSAAVTVEGTKLDCNTVHLDGETVYDSPFSIVDAGGNVCGCGGDVVDCQVLSSDLTPPETLPDG
jgi:parallel beta helix pectate lyase-like protein